MSELIVWLIKGAIQLAIILGLVGLILFVGVTCLTGGIDLGSPADVQISLDATAGGG